MTWRSRGGKELEELQERKKKKERKEKWEEWRRTRKVNNSHEGSSWEKEVASCNLWTKRKERNRDRQTRKHMTAKTRCEIKEQLERTREGGWWSFSSERNRKMICCESLLYNLPSYECFPRWKPKSVFSLLLFISLYWCEQWFYYKSMYMRGKLHLKRPEVGHKNKAHEGKERKLSWIIDGIDLLEESLGRRG